MKYKMIGIGVTICALLQLGILIRPVVMPSAGAQTSTQAAVKDNEELSRMYQEDQSDRTPPAGKSIDWNVVAPRDKARLARVKELYAQNHLGTGNDYFHAAMILQHGGTPEDYLLAHEFCVVAIIKGKNDKGTRWLAAASEDRFLMNIGRTQRFGTQYRSDSPDGPLLLYKVDASVTDELRRALNVPTLAEAKAREAELNKK